MRPIELHECTLDKIEDGICIYKDTKFCPFNIGKDFMSDLCIYGLDKKEQKS